jgi:hypothetical protein
MAAMIEEWAVPVCAYARRSGEKEEATWEFDGVVEIAVRREWPAFLTVASAAAMMPSSAAVPMDRVPLVLLSERGRTTAYSANGSAWDCTGARHRRSSRYHAEGGLIMLHFESPVVTYTMQGATGRLALAGSCLVLSDIMCMPRRVALEDVAFLRRQRAKSIRKQLRDQRVVVDLGDGRAATFVLNTWARVDSIRGGTPVGGDDI